MGTVVVTGGAGFIGSNLAGALAAGHTVRVVDSFATGRRENVPDTVELIEATILDGDALVRAFDGADTVFHQAAIPRVARSVEYPAESHEANATGTVSVLEAARRADVRRVVYASSSSVYGDVETLPQHEGMPTAPRSPYAASKLAGESYCRAYTASYALETVSLRYFNVYGPGQDPASKYGAAPSNFASRLLSGQRPVIYGDGEQSRGFTFVEDVVAANLAAWDAPADRVSGRAFNVSGEPRVTIRRLFEIIRDAVGATGIEPEHAPARTGDVRHNFASVDAFHAATGWEAQVGLEDGCARLVDWLRASPERIVAFAS